MRILRKTIKMHRININLEKIIGLLLLLFFLFSIYYYCDLTDYHVYYLEYYGLGGHTSEIGYTVLSDLFFNLGFSFRQFYTIYIFTYVIIIYFFSFSNLKKNKLTVILLFIIFPFINTLQQIRSCLGAGIVLIGITYLQKEGVKKGYLKFVLSVLISI